jgi:hypothetical protein
MSFDYADMGVTADELIAEFGAIGTLARTTPGGYDPANGKTTVPTTVTQDVKAVVEDYPQKFIDGTLVKTGDKHVFVSAVGITEPAQGDKFTWADVAYQVINVMPINPSGAAPVLYELQVRK